MCSFTHSSHRCLLTTHYVEDTVSSRCRVHKKNKTKSLPPGTGSLPHIYKYINNYKMQISMNEQEQNAKSRIAAVHVQSEKCPGRLTQKVNQLRCRH